MCTIFGTEHHHKDTTWENAISHGSLPKFAHIPRPTKKIKDLAYPTEPTDPCCIPALGEFMR